MAWKNKIKGIKNYAKDIDIHICIGNFIFIHIVQQY